MGTFFNCPPSYSVSHHQAMLAVGKPQQPSNCGWASAYWDLRADVFSKDVSDSGNNKVCDSIAENN